MAPKLWIPSSCWEVCEIFLGAFHELPTLTEHHLGERTAAPKDVLGTGQKTLPFAQVGSARRTTRTATACPSSPSLLTLPSLSVARSASTLPSPSFTH